MAKLSPRIVSFPKGTDRAIKKQLTAKRDMEIMLLTGAELEEVLASGELGRNEYNGEINARQYYEGMNPAQLDFDATYVDHAKIELKRRKGELPR